MVDNSDSPPALPRSDGWERTTYLGPGFTPTDVFHMFSAATDLYETQSWARLPSDVFMEVSCEWLGITDGALRVIGQEDESFGFTLFRSVDDAVKLLAAAARGDRSEEPAHFRFTFEDGSALPPELLREVEHHGWPVAGPQAYPSVVFVDENRVARGLTLHEYIGMTAVVDTLAQMVEEDPGVRRAWEKKERFKQTLTFCTSHADVTVRLAGPLWLSAQGREKSPATWESLLGPDGEYDAELVEEHIDAFMTKLEDAPESGVAWRMAETLLDSIAIAFGKTIVGLTPELMNQLLFEVLPNQRRFSALSAPRILETMRALLTFADRELGARHARECLEALGPDTLARLARALGSERDSEVADSLVLEGLRSGFDLRTKKGVAAFINSTMRERTKRDD